MNTEPPNPETKEGGMSFEAWQQAMIAYAIKQASEEFPKYILEADFKTAYDEGATPQETWDDERSCW